MNMQTNFIKLNVGSSACKNVVTFTYFANIWMEPTDFTSVMATPVPPERQDMLTVSEHLIPSLVQRFMSLCHHSNIPLTFICMTFRR